MAKMKYKTGSGFYVGVPARDLTAQEVKKYGHDFLLSLGLYEDAEQPKPKKAEEKQEPKEAEEA